MQHEHFILVLNLMLMFTPTTKPIYIYIYICKHKSALSYHRCDTLAQQTKEGGYGEEGVLGMPISPYHHATVRHHLIDVSSDVLCQLYSS